MDEGGESSSSHPIYPPEIGHAPVTPVKQGQSDPNLICKNFLKNPFNEVVIEETSAKSFGCWESNLGSRNQLYDMNGGMHNGFSMDDENILNLISCRDLLALAEKGSGNGGGCGGYGSSGGGSGYGVVDLSMKLGNDNRFNSWSNSNDPQQFGQLNIRNYLTDLNMPPETETEMHVSTGIFPQFTPVTPDQIRRESQQLASDIIIPNEAGYNKEPNVSTLAEASQDCEKGLTEQTNLNETPQPKQRRRKHRPKVVTEGKPKRARKSATPKPEGLSTGKRKYVWRKGVEKTETTPTVEEASGKMGTSTYKQQTKKSCKRKINFDEVEKVTEVVVEKTQVKVTVDKTCSTSQVVEACETVTESVSLNPITPSKTELPHGRVVKNVKQNENAKRQINFLQETCDRRPSGFLGPNESICGTSISFNKGEESHGSKNVIKSMINGMEVWAENASGISPESMEAYLSMYTDFNSCMHLPTFHNKKSYAQDSKAPEMPKWNGVKVNQQSGRLQNSKKKRTKASSLVDDNGRQQQTPNGTSIYEASHQQNMYMQAHAADFHVSIAAKKQTKKSPMVASVSNDHLGCYTKIGSKSIHEVEALKIQFERLSISMNSLIPYSPRYQENNALVVYQQNGSVVPYEGVFNPVKKRKPRPKVDLDEETSRVWRLLLEDINSQGIDGTDEAKEKWWEEERRVFRGRADSFIARMHLVQGDRRFSRWKGSVLDSVVGVFLTQNVSDHLSSSAFMSLASRYPLKSESSNEPPQEENMSVNEPCHVDQEAECAEKEADSTEDHGQMILQEADSCGEKEVVYSNQVSKVSAYTVDLNDNSECEAEKDMGMYKETVVVDQIEVEDIVSSQNSSSSVQSSVVQTTSFVELLNMQGPTAVKKPEVEVLEMREERNIIQKKNEKECASEESGISAESASQVTVQMVNTTNSNENTKIITEQHTETVKATKVVEFSSNEDRSHQTVNGVNEGSSKVSKKKNWKERE